jgi:hypothetical protein
MPGSYTSTALGRVGLYPHTGAEKKIPHHVLSSKLGGPSKNQELSELHQRSFFHMYEILFARNETSPATYSLDKANSYASESDLFSVCLVSTLLRKTA